MHIYGASLQIPNPRASDLASLLRVFLALGLFLFASSQSLAEECYGPHEGLIDKNGLKQGFGTSTFTDCPYQSYSGEWVDGRFEGYGKLAFRNGTTYVGEFLAGQFHGEGKLKQIPAKYTYVGGWKKSKFHGQGSYTSDGVSYVGEYLDGKQHGHGTWKENGKVVYRGGFKAGRYHGYGVAYMRGGEFHGYFRQDEISSGKFVAPEFVYEGDFDNWSMDGSGTLIYLTGANAGTKLVGGFKNDELHGVVQIYQADGRSGTQRYSNGVMLEQLSYTPNATERRNIERMEAAAAAIYRDRSFDSSMTLMELGATLMGGGSLSSGPASSSGRLPLNTKTCVYRVGSKSWTETVDGLICPTTSTRGGVTGTLR